MINSMERENLALANRLIRLIGADINIDKLEMINLELFEIFLDNLFSLKRKDSDSDVRSRYKLILETISKRLDVSLDHIFVENLINKDVESVHDLLEIFEVLFHPEPESSKEISFEEEKKIEKEFLTERRKKLRQDLLETALLRAKSEYKERPPLKAYNRMGPSCYFNNPTINIQLNKKREEGVLQIPGPLINDFTSEVKEAKRRNELEFKIDNALRVLEKEHRAAIRMGDLSTKMTEMQLMNKLVSMEKNKLKKINLKRSSTLDINEKDTRKVMNEIKKRDGEICDLKYSIEELNQKAIYRKGFVDTETRDLIRFHHKEIQRLQNQTLADEKILRRLTRAT